MFTNHSPKLTSAEIGLLWTQYMNETAFVCFHTHMIEHIEENDIRNVFEYAMSLSQKHLKTIKDFFEAEQFPIPIGFGKEDVTLNKPRLFSDVFCLHYLNIMSSHGAQGYSAAVTNSSRPDVIKYFRECNTTSIELFVRTIEILQKKGLYYRPPVIVPPDRPDFVQHKHFLAGWFGDQRPLSAIEIMDIYTNLKKSMIAKTVTLAFGQITPDKDIRKFFLKAVREKNKHIEMFHDVLNDGDLPSVPSLDSEVSNTTVSPFSNKIMLFHVGFLYSTSMIYYGQAWAQSPRKDLSVKYPKIIADDLGIGGECMELMIDKAWLEQPPLAEDRTELSKKKQ